MPPLPGVEEYTSLTRNFREDQDPVAEESSPGSDDDQTLAFILKRRKKAADSANEGPIPTPALPENHPTKSRTAVRKRKASELADVRYEYVYLSSESFVNHSLSLFVVRSHTKQPRLEIAMEVPADSDIPSPLDSPILGVVGQKLTAPPQHTVDASTLPAKNPASIDTSSQRVEGAGHRITGLSTLPASVQASLTADLIDDPLLLPEKLKVLQDNLKSCYKITTVRISCRVLFLASLFQHACTEDVMMFPGDCQPLVSQVSECEGCC
jgi:hypothetical protein